MSKSWRAVLLRPAALLSVLVLAVVLLGLQALRLHHSQAQTTQLSQAPQGDWVGRYGSAGYALAAWDGTKELSYFPQATLVVEQGSRHRWNTSTSEVRALQDPGKTTRRATTFYASTSIKLRLDFNQAYSGNLHLYALDWTGKGRRQTVAVDDGSGPRSVALSTSFNQGAWIHLPLNVAAQGAVSITVTRTAGDNAVLAGVFLGDAGPPASAQLSQAPQGNWAGNYGSAGYALAAWDGTKDLSYFPQGTLVVERGARYRWNTSTSEVRALQDPGKTTRRATTFYDSTSVKLRLNFSQAYSGDLHLYALDWSGKSRRQTVAVDDGSGPRTVALSTSFNQGAWIHQPVNVAAQGSVSITVTRTAGDNAVLAGVFLGNAGPPASEPVVVEPVVVPPVVVEPVVVPPPVNTYYVAANGSDANSGTSPSAPWQSLQKVSDAVIAPGEKVLFNRGDAWSGTLSMRRSGTTEARIVIGAYGTGALPVFQGGQSCIYVFSSYVTVTEVQTQNCVWGGVDIHGSDNRVENNVINNNAAGVVLNTGANRNVVVNNQFKDNNRMSVNTPTPTNDDSGAFGVVVAGDDNEVAYNTISGSLATSYDYGQDGAALEVYGGQRNFFHHNVTSQNDTFVEMGDSRAADNTFAYNSVVSTISKSFFLVTRGPNDTFGPVKRTNLYNNSVYLPGDQGEGVICYAGCSTEILTVRNNIIRAVKKVGYADGPFTQSNNLFSGGAFQGLLGGLLEPIVTILDPGYINAPGGDLRLNLLSPAIDKGFELPYKEDLDRRAVPIDGNGDGVVVPDIGAYEFRP